MKKGLRESRQDYFSCMLYFNEKNISGGNSVCEQRWRVGQKSRVRYITMGGLGENFFKLTKCHGPKVFHIRIRMNLRKQVFSCFLLRSIDGVGGFWIFFVFRTERGGQKPKADSLNNPDFFHFAFFLLVLVYWILLDGKIIFSPKNPFPNKSELV